MADPKLRERVQTLVEAAYAAAQAGHQQCSLAIANCGDLRADVERLERDLEAAREALIELVACKDLKERAEDPAVDVTARARALDEYEHRKPHAWSAARAALAAPPATKGDEPAWLHRETGSAVSVATATKGSGVAGSPPPASAGRTNTPEPASPQDASSSFYDALRSEDGPVIHVPGTGRSDPTPVAAVVAALVSRVRVVPVKLDSLETAGQTLAAAVEHCNGRRCGNAPVIAAVGDCIRVAQYERATEGSRLEGLEFLVRNEPGHHAAAKVLSVVQERDRLKAELEALKERLGQEIARCENAEAFARQYRAKVKELQATSGAVVEQKVDALMVQLREVMGHRFDVAVARTKLTKLRAEMRKHGMVWAQDLDEVIGILRTPVDKDERGGPPGVGR